LPALSRQMRKLIVAAVALAVFLITPYFLYQSVTAFRFGEAEMRRAVEGTWTVELTSSAGARRSFTLEIQQARPSERAEREHGWIRSAAACGQRSFIRRAEACLDTSTMPLTLIALGDDRPASLRGRFIVDGKSFQRGTLDLGIDGHSIFAQLSPTGDVLEVSAVGVAATRLARVHARP
jgi:hypothetical protein